MNEKLIDGIRVDSSGTQRAGTVTYTVMNPSGSSTEKRNGRRLRTRLRSGKILTVSNKFLVECLIHDVSARGARLHLPDRVNLPDDIRLYRDDDATVSAARIVWRKPSWVGIKIIAAAAGIDAAAFSALGGKYYRVASTRPPRTNGLGTG